MSVGSNNQAIAEELKNRAKKLLASAFTDSFTYQNDLSINGDPRVFSTYARIRIFCLTYLGWKEDSDWESAENAGDLISKLAILLQNQRQILKEGAEALAADFEQDTTFVNLHYPNVMLLEKGIAARLRREVKVNHSGCHVLFFILALDELLNFIDSATAAYRTNTQRKKSIERDAANNSMIIAVSSLSHAQSAFEYGLRYMFRELSPADVAERENKAESSYMAQELGSRGQKARVMYYLEFREFAKEKAKEIVAQLSINEKISVSSLANEILKNMSDQSALFGEKSLPVAKTIEGWIKPLVPKNRARGQGRPPNKNK